MRPSPRSPDARWAVGPAAFLRDGAAAWLSQAGPGEAHLWVPSHDTGIHATHLPSDTQALHGPQQAWNGKSGPQGRRPWAPKRWAVRRVWWWPSGSGASSPRPGSGASGYDCVSQQGP